MGDLKKYILVVEDDLVMQELLRRKLESAGHAVFMAGNGEIALEKMKQALPDLIISDVFMPEMDGFTFYNKLKEDYITAQVPVLIITGREKMEDTFKSVGVEDFITKPFDSPAIMEKVEYLLVRSQVKTASRMFREKYASEYPIGHKSPQPAQEKAVVEEKPSDDMSHIKQFEQISDTNQPVDTSAGHHHGQVSKWKKALFMFLLSAGVSLVLLAAGVAIWKMISMLNTVQDYKQSIAPVTTPAPTLPPLDENDSVEPLR